MFLCVLTGQAGGGGGGMKDVGVRAEAGMGLPCLNQGAHAAPLPPDHAPLQVHEDVYLSQVELQASKK